MSPFVSKHFVTSESRHFICSKNIVRAENSPALPPEPSEVPTAVVPHHQSIFPPETGSSINFNPFGVNLSKIHLPPSARACVATSSSLQASRRFGILIPGSPGAKLSVLTR
ncbi:hypothetical protein JTB14_022125 [Gonioctena quinquepunctata]|nr:hypothetical protein JTB14_022125 [Gonioctena quinquepunctata]